MQGSSPAPRLGVPIPVASDEWQRTVVLSDLKVGALVAEGGEGRVFDLPDRPGVLYKQYRRPVGAASLDALVGWAAPPRPGEVATMAPHLYERVRRGTAWPLAVVIDPALPKAVRPEPQRPETGRPEPQQPDPAPPHLDRPDAVGPGAAAVGLLMPRAPRRFSLRHRDGIGRLATLSYLTADPVRRAAAYGLSLPAQGDPMRIGVVYALARLLEAFESAEPAVGHGDLSAKNVLWSTQRGPEVYLIDCDNSERFDVAGVPLGPPGRRRAMTPNWDDPTVPSGANPGPGTDRYSLALIFLRVVGAAHFPVQKRQKAGEAVDVELDLPPAVLRAATMAGDAPLWALVSRSLSASAPADRPPASTWAAALHDVLVDLGAQKVVDAVHSSQGSSVPSLPAQPVAGPAAPDVIVRPHGARPRAAVWTSRPTSPGPGRPSPSAGRSSGGVRQSAGPSAGGTRGTGAGGPGAVRWVASSSRAAGAGSTTQATPAPVPSLTARAKEGLAAAFAAWTHLHRRAARSLASRGRRAQGVRRLVVCAVVDFAVASVGLLLAAMIVSPFLGI